jgi:hypothetical protein
MHIPNINITNITDFVAGRVEFTKMGLIQTKRRSFKDSMMGGTHQVINLKFKVPITIVIYTI